jgi:alpha-L-arabinofuranosidase
LRAWTAVSAMMFILSGTQGETVKTDPSIRVNAGRVVNRVTRTMYGACIEDVNHEIYGGLYAQRIFGESFEEPPQSAPEETDSVSGMWDIVRTGTAAGRLVWDACSAFNSSHSQRIEYQAGEGDLGVANRGLNRWGIAVRKGRRCAGHLYLRQNGSGSSVTVALQSADGARAYARQRIGPLGDDWKRYDFSLRPDADDTNARFALWVDRPGTVWVDQVYLSDTGDGLFHGLPMRADIGRMLQEEGLTILRYGGSMVNAPEYRWKQMIGDRDRRPQYRGTWYPHSTNGFGIEDFVQFCRAAGFECVFAINIEETPQDAADLVDYLNGPATTEWGRRRAENGHPEPYGVRYIEIGNEERTDAHYLERFALLYQAMRARDPNLQFIIAAWWEPDNPVSRRIVRELDGKAALWDVHVGGDDLREGENVDRLFTQMERLVQEWDPGTNLKACVLEENGGRHDLQRALGHACILNATQRRGDFVLMDCPANCLQPWKQNDNGWDQGQVFFTGGQVWGMPPFYAQQMAAANHLPLRVAAEVSSPDGALDVTVTRSEDGSTLALKVVNIGARPHRATVSLEQFGPVAARAEVWTLTGDLTDINTPQEPDRIRSHRSVFQGAAPQFDYEFPARSYTILRLRRR